MKHVYSKENQYAERDIEELDNAGNFYMKHIDAMTVECLHSKSDIAAELAHRDYQIMKLNKTIETLHKRIATAQEYLEQDEDDSAYNAMCVLNGE